MVFHLSGGRDSLSIHGPFFDVEPQSAELIWLDLRVVLESGEILSKAERGESAPFASDFNLLEAFIIGRIKRREEFTPPTPKCVGEACDLMCDVLSAGERCRGQQDTR